MEDKPQAKTTTPANARRRRTIRALSLLLPLALCMLLLYGCGKDERPASAGNNSGDSAAGDALTSTVILSTTSSDSGVAAMDAVWHGIVTNPVGTGQTENTPGLLDRYLPAIRSGEEATLQGMERAPRYLIEVTLDVISRTLTGTAEIVVTNNSREPWNSIVFRLYPNLVHYGGDMFINSASVDGYPANFNYQDANTSVKILLPRPLLPKDQVTMGLKWTLDYPSWISDPIIYRLFGRSQEMVSLPLFYPSLAVYQEGAAIGSGRWWTDIGSERGDSAFADASLFAVSAILPSEQVPVTSGTLLRSEVVSPTQTRYVWVTGPSREFLLHMSPDFSSASQTAYGTTITSYWLPGNEAAGRAALRYGVSALRAFSDMYGDYPFADMRLAPAPISYRGMEYPQAMLLGVQLYNNQRNNLEYLVAHEMAHQWWYQMVNNDPVNTPWLDEGLAEYSVKLYFEALQGNRAADLLQWQHWESPLEILASRGNEVPIAGHVESFKSGNQYETIVYGKGALFFDHLRQELGERRFRLFLQSYLNAHKWENVTADDFLAALHIQGRPDLVQMYQDWVGSPPVPSAAAAEQVTVDDVSPGN